MIMILVGAKNLLSFNLLKPQWTSCELKEFFFCEVLLLLWV